MPLTAHALAPQSSVPSGGATLISTDGRTLPLRHTHLDARVTGGLSTTRIEQTYVNDGDTPLTVTYKLPLPADGAVCGFELTVDGQRAVGVVEKTQVACDRYEEALLDGRTAGLLEQRRSSLFEQHVGNIPPGATVAIVVTVDHLLAWTQDGAWEWRFPTVVAPRYLGGSGRVTDARQVAVPVTEDPVGVQLTATLRLDTVTGPPNSPSHTLQFDGGDGGGVATLDGRPDRDVVLRIPAASQSPGVSLNTAWAPDAPYAHGLLTVVPPEPRHHGTPVARDLILLIDTSGSQSGEPMDQSKAVALALIDSLEPDDQLQMIEFSTRPRRWKRSAQKMSFFNRRSARGWVEKLTAGGATEMAAAITEALAPLREDSQRQVLVITDGLIGFEQAIVGSVLNQTPPSCRVHTLGVGHGVNRSLTGPVARAGGGIEAICAPGENPEAVAKRLLDATARPVVVNLELSGSALVGHAPRRLPGLWAGRPALVALELDPAGGTVEVRGQTAHGPWSTEVNVPAASSNPAPATGIRARWARERVEDLELEIAAGLPKRDRDRQIEALGLEFQIATRLTSWVAVSDESTVDPEAPTREEEMPHLLAAGLHAEGLGLRSGFGGMPPAQAGAPMPSKALAAPKGGGGLRRRAKKRKAEIPPPPMEAMPIEESEALSLFDADDFARAGAPPVPGDAVSGGAAPTPTRDELRAFADEEEPSFGLLGVANQGMDGQGGLQRAVAVRLTSTSDGRLVIRFSLGVDTTWERPTTVALELADGRVLTLSPSTVSTGSGPVTADMTLRLVLDGQGHLRELVARVLVGDWEINAA